MKKTFVAFTLLLASGLTSGPALASSFGTPDQDPIIRALRSRFLYGRAPTYEEMRLFFEVPCVERTLDPIDYNDHPATPLTLLELDGSILMSPEQSATKERLLYASNGLEFAAVYGGGGPDHNYEMIAYRMDRNGKLIGERSATHPKAPSNVRPYAGSMFDDRHVTGYLVCTRF
jgi:hypothetical protein